VNWVDGMAVAYEAGMTTGELHEYGTLTVDGTLTETTDGSHEQTLLNQVETETETTADDGTD